MKQKTSFLFRLFLRVTVFTVFMQAGSSFAQHNLMVTVNRSEDGKPLAGASVSLQPGNLAGQTDSTGQLEIRNLATGSYMLTVTYVGYSTHTEKFYLNRSRQLSASLQSKVYQQQEIQVNATRVNRNDGFSFSDIDKEEISKANTGRDLPYLLDMTPSLVTTSDAGGGIGYTGVRIRGSDGTRINVTINGVPLNDAESQAVYFVDLPDLASSVENIQVQRGIGSSTNGAGAFGGSINIMTSKPGISPYASASQAYGSFNTIKNNLSLGTGMLRKHWAVEGRISGIRSDGYIDRASSNLKSYYLTGGYFSGRAIVKFTMLSGHEITYQAWNGVPEYLLNSNRTYNAFTYKDQVDNYQQDHYQLLLGYDLFKDLHLHITLHETKGKGYYEEYKPEDDLYGGGLYSTYGLSDLVIGDDTMTSTNLVRRKWLDNTLYGAVFSLSYDPGKKINVTLGGSWNQYQGGHYNKLIWMQVAGTVTPDYTYESDQALKTDFNTYCKVHYAPVKKLRFTADLQVRQVVYHFTGLDATAEQVPQHDHLLFINPKLGLNWNFHPKLDLYISAGKGNKEPSRDDYTESSKGSRPKPEQMIDTEAGIHFNSGRTALSVNFYRMFYKDQLVLTGKVNDVGNYTRINVPESYRQGIELQAGFNPLTFLSLKGTITFSENKIRSFEEYIDNYDDGTQQMIRHRNTTLAFSPSLIASGMISVTPLKNLTLDLITRHVGRQYLDNTSDQKRKINDYTMQDVRLSYSMHFKWLKEIRCSLLAGNIFSKKYASNGYTFSYIYGGEFVTENFYYPQALNNFLGQVTVTF